MRSKGTDPEWIAAKGFIDIGDELLRGGMRKREILDDIAVGKAALVKGVVHDSCAHEAVQQPAGEAVKRSYEVPKGIGTGPESATIVAEEIVDQGNSFDCGSGRRFLPYFLGM
jgi:hypothetical protein